MILIKGGKMFMGARDLDDNAAAKPPHEVMVPSYCLDKAEVTAAPRPAWTRASVSAPWSR